MVKPSTASIARPVTAPISKGRPPGKRLEKMAFFQRRLIMRPVIPGTTTTSSFLSTPDLGAKTRWRRRASRVLQVVCPVSPTCSPRTVFGTFWHIFNRPGLSAFEIFKQVAIHHMISVTPVLSHLRSRQELSSKPAPPLAEPSRWCQAGGVRQVEASQVVAARWWQSGMTRANPRLHILRAPPIPAIYSKQ